MRIHSAVVAVFVLSVASSIEGNQWMRLYRSCLSIKSSLNVRNYTIIRVLMPGQLIHLHFCRPNKFVLWKLWRSMRTSGSRPRSKRFFFLFALNVFEHKIFPPLVASENDTLRSATLNTSWESFSSFFLFFCMLTAFDGSVANSHHRSTEKKSYESANRTTTGFFSFSSNTLFSARRPR